MNKRHDKSDRGRDQKHEVNVSHKRYEGNRSDSYDRNREISKNYVRTDKVDKYDRKDSDSDTEINKEKDEEKYKRRDRPRIVRFLFT